MRALAETIRPEDLRSIHYTFRMASLPGCVDCRRCRYALSWRLSSLLSWWSCFGGQLCQGLVSFWPLVHAKPSDNGALTPGLARAQPIRCPACPPCHLKVQYARAADHADGRGALLRHSRYCHMVRYQKSTILSSRKPGPMIPCIHRHGWCREKAVAAIALASMLAGQAVCASGKGMSNRRTHSWSIESLHGYPDASVSGG